MNDIYNLNCAEYKDDEEGKKNYISLVYASIIIKHMVAQVNTGLIEYVELTEPSEEKYINPILEDNYSFEKANEMFLEHINKCEKLPRYILINKLNKDKSFLNKININKFTGEIDINDLLLLKYNGHDVISTSTIRSLDFYMYMNQPTKWFAVTYNNISELRNTLFLFTNIINNNIKFNSSLLIEIDKEYAKFKRDMPQEFRFSNTAYRTDPPILFLYKRRIYSSIIANRIFLYRVMIRLVMESSSSKDITSNIKIILNRDFINKVYDKKLYLNEMNKDFYENYCKRHNFIIRYYENQIKQDNNSKYNHIIDNNEKGNLE